MTINYAQQVHDLLKGMTYHNYKKPTAEQMQEVLSSGRSRILKTSESDQLCPLSVEFFPFCWSVIGRFGAASYNAVEIGALCKIQPFIIACAVHEYGVDWAHRLFTLKRIVGYDRGLNTILQGNDWHWSVAELRRRVSTDAHPLTKRQASMAKSIRRSELDELRDDVYQHGNLVLSVVNPGRVAVFKDPRKREQAVKKIGNAMTVVTPKTEKQRLHELAVHPLPVDKSNPQSGHVRKIRGSYRSFVLPN